MTRSELDRLQIAAQNATSIDPRMKIGSLFSGGDGGNGIVATVTEWIGNRLPEKENP